MDTFRNYAEPAQSAGPLGWRDLRSPPVRDADLAPRAAHNYLKLREVGVTIRKTAGIIGTFSIERRHWLLHDDRDFAPMEEHLGLKAV